jgi:hypothetical protein
MSIANRIRRRVQKVMPTDALANGWSKPRGHHGVCWSALLLVASLSLTYRYLPQAVSGDDSISGGRVLAEIFQFSRQTRDGLRRKIFGRTRSG